MIVKGYAYNDKTCTDIRKFIEKNYTSFYSLMYKYSLDDIPLLINHEIDIVKTIAIWRLNIGK